MRDRFSLFSWKAAATPALLALALAACSSKANTGGASTAPSIAQSGVLREPASSVSQAAIAGAVAANNAFAVDLFGRVRATAPAGNLLTSPISASLALTMTYAGAAGATATQMATALHFGAAAGSIFDGQNAISQNVVNIANSLNITNGTDVDLIQSGTTNGLATPGTYVLFQVAGGSIAGGPSGLVVTDPQPLTAYTFTTVSGAAGTDVDLIVANTAPVYSFNYNGLGGSQNTDLTVASWYNLTSGVFDGQLPGAGNVAQFDSVYGSLASSTTFSLSSTQVTSWAGLSVLSPGPAQYADNGNVVPLVMTATLPCNLPMVVTPADLFP